jgi:hypothetical protein
MFAETIGMLAVVPSFGANDTSSRLLTADRDGTRNTSE